MPFNFGEEEMNLDDSVTATCSITKGDLPLKIWWTFQGVDDLVPYNLTSNDGIVISRTGQKISMLAIDSLRPLHRGLYSCYAQNKGGFTNHSANLAING